MNLAKFSAKNLRRFIFSFQLFRLNIRPFTKKSSEDYMKRHINDPYVKKSKQMNFRSRGAFKLHEINEKYKFLRPGQKVLDLGSAPGGWSQVIAKAINSNKEKPSLVSLDILPMNPIEGCTYIQGDFTNEKVKDDILSKNNFEKFDVICSDMCPEFTGNKLADHAITFDLNSSVINFAMKVLKKNGILVMKTFDGSLHKQLYNNTKIFFEKIIRVKPTSSRSESSEVFLYCTGFLENLEITKDDSLKLNPEDQVNEEREFAKRIFTISKFTEENKDISEKLQTNLQNDKLDINNKETLDKETALNLKKTYENEEDELMRELTGKTYINQEESEFEGYKKKYERDMKEYEKKYEEVIKNEKIDSEDAKKIFEDDDAEKYAEESFKELEREVSLIDEKNQELMNKIDEEEKKSLVQELEGEEKEGKYTKWEKVLSKINLRNKMDDSYIDKNEMELEKQEYREMEEFNSLYKNLGKEKMIGKQPKNQSSFFEDNPKFR